MRRCFPIVVATLVVVSACQGKEGSNTPPAPEYRLNATIKDIMDSFVDPSADYIWDAVSTTVIETPRFSREDKYSPNVIQSISKALWGSRFICLTHSALSFSVIGPMELSPKTSNVTPWRISLWELPSSSKLVSQ